MKILFKYEIRLIFERYPVMELEAISELSEKRTALATLRPLVQGKKCIYFKEKSCEAPFLKFAACKTCPFARPNILKKAVHSIYDYIKSLYVFFSSSPPEISKKELN